jgi:hypothetical protein
MAWERHLQRRRTRCEDGGEDLPLQRPNKFSGFLVSMVCIEPGSTRTMGRSERRGMLAMWRAVVAGAVGI